MINIILFLLFLYLVLILYLLIIATIQPVTPCSEFNAENVSIVIPCKNEAKNLPMLFTSLKQQQFSANIEIIIVDDGSTDATESITHNFQNFQNDPVINVKYIRNRFSPDNNLTSKQQAIDAGIREATHDVIVLTDADMTFDHTWLRSLFASFSPDTDLLFGHTAILPDSGFFSFLQSFQLEFLFSVAAVFHYARIQGSCMGNNLMVRKKAYLECGGQKAIGYSITEDRALLCLFNKNKRTIGITKPFHPKAFTWPHTKPSLFINQMARWAKGGFGTGMNLLFFAVLFSIQNVSFIISIFGYINSSLTGITLINFFLTWCMILLLFKKNKSPVSALYFPVFFVFLLVETCVLPVFLTLRNTIIWKGNSI